MTNQYLSAEQVNRGIELFGKGVFRFACKSCATVRFMAQGTLTFATIGEDQMKELLYGHNIRSATPTATEPVRSSGRSANTKRSNCTSAGDGHQ
jgi:hypothetical protein